MNGFTYQIYYEYSGPTIASPFEEQKSPEEIAGALSTFPNDLRHFLGDLEARVDQDHAKRTPTSIFIVVTTNLSEQQLDDGIKQCLDAFHLFGKKLSGNNI